MNRTQAQAHGTKKVTRLDLKPGSLWGRVIKQMFATQPKLFKDPNWQGGLPVGYLQSMSKDLNRGLPRNKSKLVVREGTRTWGFTPLATRPRRHEQDVHH